MKKIIAAAALIMTVGLVGINFADAGPGWRGGYGGGPGWCNGPYGSTDENYEARQQFFNDTQELRQQLFEKRSEYRDIMNQESPDKDAAAKVWSEMFDLQQQMQAKATEAGVTGGFGGRGGSYGPRGGGFVCDGPYGAGNVPCNGPGYNYSR